MKLLTFATSEDPFHPRIGVLSEQVVIDLDRSASWVQQATGLAREDLPATMLELIHAPKSTLEYVHQMVASVRVEDFSGLSGAEQGLTGYPLEQVTLYTPIIRPMSLRDFYAFEKHVSAANAIRGREVPQEWYSFPVFYFCNPNSVIGHRDPVPYPSYSQALDYELEVACIIGKPGIDIPAEKAEEYIFGYTIFNDWSARDVQRQEMKVGLGPAKGKDFASSLGPWIVTPDELAGRATGRPGVYDLWMAARVNGEERSRGNWKDIHYSFGEMVARASQDVFLLPGEVLGSGTVGTGCLLELTKGEGPWLQPGDVVDLEIELMGVLTNKVETRQSTATD